jgi:hypothetical protein
MDALPSEPPALVAAEHQASLDAVGRLAATDAWLDEQEAALHEALWPAPVGDGGWAERLDAYWQTIVPTSSGGVPRREAFEARLAQAMRDDAAIRAADGTVVATAPALVRLLTAGETTATSPRVHDLLIDNVHVPGAIAVTDASAGVVALFTGNDGWQVFPSMDLLCEAFRDQLLERKGPHTLATVLGHDALGRLGVDLVVTPQERPTGTPSVLQGRLEATLLERVKEAASWPDDGTAGSDSRLRDRLAGAVSLRPWLDPAALFHARERRLVADAIARRVGRLPATQQAAWRAAAYAYGAAVASAPAPAEVMSVHQFARSQLASALQSLGITEDPGALRLRRNHAASNGYKIIRWSEDTPLIDASLRSLGWLNLVPLTVITASEDVRLHHQEAITLLRGLDIHERYPAYLDEQLRSATAGDLWRSQAMDLLLARMRFELEDARASTFLDDEENDLLDDHTERGYAFVRAVLDAPIEAERMAVEGHAIEVRQIELDGARLEGVLEIGARQMGAVSRVILYTPDAPDGRAFREFADRREATQRFFANPRFTAYLAARLPESWGSTTSDGSLRRFCVACPTGVTDATPWTSAGVHPVAVTIRDDFRAAVYDATVARLGIEAARFTRPAAEADLSDAKVVGHFAIEAALSALPIRVGLAVSAGRGLYSLWQGAEHAARGDSKAATQAYVGAMTTWFDLVAARVVTRTTFHAMFVPARRLATGLLHVPGRLARLRLPGSAQHAPFERRYLAARVEASKLRAGADGTLSDGSRHLILEEGHYFQVSHDADNGTWRLTAPGGAATAYRPAVHRVDGHWVHNRRVGLLGGQDRPADLFDLTPIDTLERYRMRSVDTATLAPSQRRALVAALGDDISDAAKNKLIYDAIHARATRALRVRWDAAVRDARQVRASSGMPKVESTPPTHGFSLVKVERSQWPTQVYHYTKRTTYSEHFAGQTRDLYLHQSTPLSTRPPGLHVMTLGPNEPTERIATLMRGTNWVQLNRNTEAMRNLAGGYIAIDLQALGDRIRPDGTYEFSLYSITNRSPLQFVLRPNPPATSHGLTPPPSPSSSQDLTSVRLRPGDYTKGTRH